MKLKRRVVIPVDHFPVRMPGTPTMLIYVVLDIYKSIPGWAHGVIWSLVALMWLGWAVGFVRQEERPLNGYGEDPAQ